MTESTSTTDVIDLPHHHQSEFCRTRPAYRQGRELTAVKVYTVNSESTHILIFGVPKINLRQELKALLQKYGKMKLLVVSPNYPCEDFTECYHANYDKLQAARVAKKFVDMKNFYGSVLHVCYAPELETVDETRQKLNQRRQFLKKYLSNFNKFKNMNKNNVNNGDSEFPIESNAKQIDYINKPDFRLYESILSQNSTSYITNLPNGDSVNATIEMPGVSHRIVEENIDLKNSCTTDYQNAIVASTSEISNSTNSTTKRSYDDNKEYVFKRKRKRKSTKDRNKFNNLITTPKVDINISNNLENNQFITEKVTVFEEIANPRIVNVPKKSTNKIIMKINSKLI